MRRPGIVAATLAAVLALAGCAAPGSGGRAGGPATPAPTGAPTTATSSPTATATPTAEAATWGPTQAELSRARRLVADMSPAELAGAVLVARYSGEAPPTGLVQRLHLGGVVVMGDNVGDVRTLRERSQRLQSAAGRPYPLMVAVDQEGGLVARVGGPATELPPAMALGAADDPALAGRVAAASGEELRALGFTTVFAPVADVTAGPSDPTIGSRSISSRPETVARLLPGLLDGYAEAGVVPVVKHFPGHGSVTADSHQTLPVQDASIGTLRTRDWVPFVAAVRHGAPAIMVAHLDVRAVDPGVPSSLSRDLLVGQLRERLGFEGLIVTDALEMGAVAGRYGSGEAAVRAVAAGADVVLMPPDVAAAHAALVTAVDDGSLSPARLRAAASRVVAAMLHQAAAGDPPDESVVGSHRRVSLDLSRAAVTVVSGRCTGRLVGQSVQVVGGTEQDRARFAAAAGDAGLAVGSGAVVRLVGHGDAAARGDVVVALDTPYALADSTAGTARVALFGRTAEAFQALVDVLVGERAAPGRLPVTVRGVRPGC